MFLVRRQWVWIGVSAAGVLVVLAGAAGFAVYAGTQRVPTEHEARGRALAVPAAESAEPRTEPAPSAAAATSACEFTPADPGADEPRPITTPAPIATLTGTVRATMRTNLGALTLELDAGRAPCTVHSFAHLVAGHYYADTDCHRLTTEGIWVLQCGDPNGTGTGTPGYTFGDENLPAAGAPAYPRGTLAMANSGPGTNGSQFFLVYRDSDIPPDYTIFGRVTAGIEIVERVAAGGTEDGGPDGSPKIETVITEIALG